MSKIGNFGQTLPVPRRNLVERKVKPVTEPRKIKPLQFEARKWRDSGIIFIMKTGDKLHRPLMQGFANWKEARDYRLKHRDELVRLWDVVKLRDNVSDSSIRSKDEVINSCLGYDITPEQFLEKYPFRGVEFGKWQDDRQGRLNKAANALQDLSKVVDLVGASLTINIGLAFGARGSGKFAAHWEPDTNCINLTKTQGAGCLAHEWYHAYDLGYGAYLSRHIPVPKTFFSRCNKADASRGSKRYWSTTSEIGARLFEQWVKFKLKGMGIRNDYLVNILPVELFEKNPECYPYLLEEETQDVYRFFDDYFGSKF